jgi:hypothetical protein
MADIQRKGELFRRTARLKEGKRDGKHQDGGNSPNYRPIRHTCRESLAFDPQADKKEPAEMTGNQHSFFFSYI